MDIIELELEEGNRLGNIGCDLALKLLDTCTIPDAKQILLVASAQVEIVEHSAIRSLKELRKKVKDSKP